MLRLTARNRDILTGLVAIVVSTGLITAGIKIASGALRPSYQVSGLFTSAGQGLLPGSDVKIRGVNIGRVDGIDLEQGQARITLDIDEGEEIPVTATAVIRPKTLFGEKFVDIVPGPDEASGPFLADGGELVETIGGFELQRVLNDAYPILQAIEPRDVAIVLETMAESGRGLGETINRSIGSFARLADVQARHDADTRQLLGDLADLSEGFATAAEDLVAAARDLNVALPELNAHGDELGVVLEQAARLSTDVADVLEANTGFLEKNITLGGRTIGTLYEQRAQLGPLVTGLRQFVQTLAEAIRFDLADGTRLAAVKFVAGGGSPFGRVSAGGSGAAGAGSGGRGGASGLLDGLGGPIEVPTGGDVARGADAILSLLGEVLG